LEQARLQPLLPIVSVIQECILSASSWALDNAHITMHLSGRAQYKMFIRSATRFLENLARYRAGEPVAPIFDPKLGY